MTDSRKSLEAGLALSTKRHNRAPRVFEDAITLPTVEAEPRPITRFEAKSDGRKDALPQVDIAAAQTEVSTDAVLGDRVKDAEHKMKVGGLMALTGVGILAAGIALTVFGEPLSGTMLAIKGTQVAGAGIALTIFGLGVRWFGQTARTSARLFQGLNSAAQHANEAREK